MTRKKIQQPPIEIKTRQNQPDWYSVALANALVLYAEANKDFKDILKSLVIGLPKRTQLLDNIKVDKRAAALLPGDVNEAGRRAEWLTGSIMNNSLPGAEEAQVVLQSYIAGRPLSTPKQLIIGIVGMAIIGPTLGLIDKKKVMISIIRKDLVKHPGYKQAKLLTQVSHGVMLSAVEQANGNIHKLDPDMADWFFGDRDLRVYSGTREQLERTEQDLKSLGIAYATAKDSEGPAVMAMSPVVNSHYSELYWQLERVK